MVVAAGVCQGAGGQQQECVLHLLSRVSRSVLWSSGFCFVCNRQLQCRWTRCGHPVILGLDG